MNLNAQYFAMDSSVAPAPTSEVNPTESPATFTAWTVNAPLHSKIALFGIFGVQNIGNECTLEAMLHNLREHQPQAEIYSISYRPEDTAARHRLNAVAISARKGKSIKPVAKSKVRGLLRKAFVSLPTELVSWVQAWRTLRGTDLVLMTGTGMLTDWCTSAFGYPYDIFKWVLAAKVARCKIAFVSIGVGPLDAKLSRVFIKLALGMADYRSYRDEYSKERLATLGFKNPGDPIFPDLAFSLPKGIFPSKSETQPHRQVIGVGVMDYFNAGSSAEVSRQAYLGKMAAFIAWLLEHGYYVRILHGDVGCDATVRQDLKAALVGRGLSYEGAGIVDEDIFTVKDLLGQLALCKLVISSRYHNLLLSVMLNTPVISISYDPKNDALLAGVGLGDYCQPIEKLSVETLIAQFLQLIDRSKHVRSTLGQRAKAYRRMLDQQYKIVLQDL